MVMRQAVLRCVYNEHRRKWGCVNESIYGNEADTLSGRVCKDYMQVNVETSLSLYSEMKVSQWVCLEKKRSK